MALRLKGAFHTLVETTDTLEKSMPKKIAALCKPHFNPIAVMVIGACMGIGIILPFIPGSTDETFLYRWQSMIGAIGSAVIAFGLFQYQRHLDRKAQRMSVIFAAIRALTRIKSHYENVKIAFAKSTIERVRDRSKTPRTGIAREQDEKAVLNSIADVIMLCGKYTDILSAIPRDQVVASDIIAEIDELHESIDMTAHGFTMLLDYAGPHANWGGMDENGVPMIVVNALRLLEDTSEQVNQINETYMNIQRYVQ